MPVFQGSLKFYVGWTVWTVNVLVWLGFMVEDGKTWILVLCTVTDCFELCVGVCWTVRTVAERIQQGIL